MRVPPMCSAAVLYAALAAPLAAQAVKLDFNEKVDFAALRSYAWKDTQEPAPKPLDHHQLTRLVERELAAKELVKAEPGAAHVLVRYFARIDKRTRATGRSEETGLQPADRRTVVDFSRQQDLKLILELYTPAGLEPVWSAEATEVLAPAGRQDQQIDQLVARLLAEYPPKAR